MSLCSYHFSVDDVLDCLLEVSDREQGLFEHPFFAFLQQLHDLFDVKVDLYLFLRKLTGNAQRTLADVSESLKPSFQASPWIRFGPHALDNATPPYAQTLEAQREFCESVYDHILRFAGQERASRWVRLHYFSECYELATFFRSRQVDALLTTDKPALSYRLPESQNEQLARQGCTEFAGIRFVRSHVRLENLVDRSLDDLQLECELERQCAGSTCAVIFTHEYELARPEVREMTLRVFSWLRRKQLTPIDDMSLAISNALDSKVIRI